MKQQGTCKCNDGLSGSDWRTRMLKIEIHAFARTCLLVPALVCVCLLGSAQTRPAAVVDQSLSTATAQELQGGLAIKGPYVRILVRYFGVYRVYARELEQSGATLASVAPAKLGLWNDGKPCPVYVSARDPNRLGPDDHIEFVGDAPPGTFTTWKPNNTYNVYFLNLACERPLQYKVSDVSAKPVTTQKPVFEENIHREEDIYFYRLAIPPDVTDNFFWFLYQAGNSTTYEARFDFPGYANALGPIKIAVRVFGLTNAANVKPNHKFRMQFGKQDIGAFEFDGLRPYTFTTNIPAEAVKPNERLYFITPPDRKSAVDSIGMDCVDISYPRILNGEQRECFRFNNRLVSSKVPAILDVPNVTSGTRVFGIETASLFLPGNTQGSVRVEMSDVPTTFVAVAPEGLCHVESLAYREGDGIRPMQVTSGTETLVLYHPELGRGPKLYQEYRNANGIRTAITDVTDVYDRLSTGYQSDVALKRYIRWARSQSPSLKYLVLFGDSTYNYRESIRREDEQGDRGPDQVLIPIHWIYSPGTTWTSGYPDDNWYGAFGRGNTPEIAVGRIPANHESDAVEYLRKIIEYEQLAKSKKDKALLVSSVESSFQDLVRDTEKNFQNKFTTTTLLFPESKTATREVQRLTEELDDGVQLLYYVGHGGLRVWRVGPVDFEKQKDLFTPKDVVMLRNSGRYPIISCASCYTTSFENEFSIGESFVIQPHAGAIALIGTPWKSTVYEDHAFNVKFFAYYLDKSVVRVGDAFLKAKLAMVPPNAVDYVDLQTFTLLGDPCVALVNRL